MANYLKPHKWVYLNEVVERSNNSQQQTGNFRITNAISNPRHAFVFGINTANIDSQTANPFLYNTFALTTANANQPANTSRWMISRLEMEMNTPIFTLNQLQIQQEFSEK